MFGVVCALRIQYRERARRRLLALSIKHGDLPPDELSATEHVRLQLRRTALHGITMGAQAHALRVVGGVRGGLFTSSGARAAFIGLPPARRAAVRRISRAVPRVAAGGFGDGGGVVVRRLMYARIYFHSKSMCYIS